MSKSNKDNKKGSTKISKKRLLPYEREQFKLIGEVDLSQNWLEIFTPAIVSDLFAIMHSNSNNQKKAEYIQEEMGYYGFQDVNLGTNIYTMSNPAYPGVVFKFALDDNGLADNFNDAILQYLVDDYLGEDRSTPTLARHPSGIVSVQERWVIIRDQDRMDTFRPSILKALKKLSEEFLIVDLSPSHYHLNYGIDRHGRWRFADASDLYPLSNIKEKIRCRKAVGYDEKKKKMQRCGGKLRYNEDFSLVICTKCGSEYYPLEVRPNDKEDKVKMANSMLDGLTIEEREKLRQEEAQSVYASGGYTKLKKNSEYDETAEPEKPKASFTDPRAEKPAGTKADKGVVIIEDEDDEDESPSVKRQKMFEPSQDSLQRARTPFDNPVRDSVIIVSMDDENDEPEEAPTEERDDDPMDHTGNEEPSIEYSIERDDDGQSCIKLVIHGDVGEALRECTIPIFIGFGDESESYNAVSARAMADLLLSIALDLEEERNAIYGERDAADEEDEE